MLEVTTAELALIKHAFATMDQIEPLLAYLFHLLPDRQGTVNSAWHHGDPLVVQVVNQPETRVSLEFPLI